MKFEEFEELIKKNISYDVERTTVNKNGVEYDALMINSNDIARLVIKFDENFTEDDIPRICKDIEDKVNNAPTPDELHVVTSWDYAKDNLRMCIRRKADDDKIKKPFLNLEKYVRVIVRDEDGEPIASYAVSKSTAEKWGMSQDDIFLVAEQSNFTPFSFKSEYLVEILGNAVGMPLDILKEQNPAWRNQVVLSTKDGMHGASAILNEFALKDVARKLGSNEFYIIPSSIHEVICVNTNGVKDSDLKNIVGMVNAEVVGETDVLSDSVYIYSDGVIDIASV